MTPETPREAGRQEPGTYFDGYADGFDAGRNGGPDPVWVRDDWESRLPTAAPATGLPAAEADYLTAKEQSRLACVCGHRLIRHTEYGCTDCGTSEASTPQHNFQRTSAALAAADRAERHTRFEPVKTGPRGEQEALRCLDCGAVGQAQPADRAERGLPLDAGELRLSLRRLVDAVLVESAPGSMSAVIAFDVLRLVRDVDASHEAVEAFYAARLAADPQSPTGEGDAG